MKKGTKEFLLKKRLLVAVPVTVSFKIKKGGSARFKATKGEYVVKWKDVLAAIRHEHSGIYKEIRKSDSWTMGEILDDDVEEWLK